MSLVVPFEDLFKDETKLLAKHESWERVELGEVCEVLNGFAFKSAGFNKSDGFPVVRIRDLMRGRSETLYKGDYPRECVVENGDLLVGMDGNFGCYEWIGGEALLNQRVCKLIPSERYLDRKFLLFAINGYLKAIQEATSSVTVGHLSSRDIQKIPIPFPSLTEQRRIVAKLEKLASRVKAAQARLSTISRVLKRFRQSVLAAACSGKLTADWREQGSSSDNSSEITQRVFEFRRATWERLQLQKMISNGKSPKNNKWKVKYPEPDEARVEDLPELPKQWAWLKLGILGRDPLNTVQTGPFGALLHNSEFTKTGVPVVAVGNLTGMGFSHDGLYFISKVKAEQLARFDVWAGDVLFARSGATTGKVCVAPPEVQNWRMTGHILRARLNTDVVSPEFMVYALHGSPTVREQVTGNLRGATRPGFNTSLLEVIDIPVAPLTEQQEIVRRVEALFKTADILEARYRTATAHVDKLAQSILAKAFRGELVPQDPKDEPASLLLQRIRASQNLTCSPKKKQPSRHYAGG